MGVTCLSIRQMFLQTPPHGLVFPLGSGSTSTHSVFTAAGEPVCSIYAHNWGEERWIWQWGATVSWQPVPKCCQNPESADFWAGPGVTYRFLSEVGLSTNLVKGLEDTGFDKAAMTERKSTSITTWGPWLNVTDFLNAWECLGLFFFYDTIHYFILEVLYTHKIYFSIHTVSPGAAAVHS